MLVIETFVSNLVCWDISSTRNMFSLYKETFEYGEYGLHNIRHAIHPIVLQRIKSRPQHPLILLLFT